MDFFKSQLERIQKQLAALTPSQKMLTAAMVAIMVMTLVWWGKYAGEPEMDSLFPQAVSTDELPRVETELQAKGIKYVMVGDKIMVPADRKVEAIASLMYSHILPRNAKDGFDEVLKNINPFMSQSMTDKMWNRGKETTVGLIITDFPDVAEAHVMIDPTREVHIGTSVDPSATVTITMRPGAKAPQQLVDAAADVVQGALSSLSRSKIKIVVDGYPRHVHLDDAASGMMADDQQEKIQKAELSLEEKIKGELSYIPGLMVAVTVKLNTTNETIHQVQIDPKLTISKPIETHTKSSETTGGAAANQEAGVGANTGLSVSNATGPAAPSGPSTTTEETTEKNQILASQSEIERTTKAGDTTPVAAAVRVPMAYFAAIYVKDNPGAKEPSEKQMRGLIDAELPKIKRDVAMCTNLKAEGDNIAVETYVDPTPVVVAPQTVTAGVSMALVTGGHIREAVLGVLAVVSLFMMSMVVKKGTPAPVVATASAATNANGSPSSLIDAMGEVVGEVGSAVTTLDGMELDDDALRTQQMLDQVSSLVKENPDSAATLVKRWLNRA